MQQDSIVGPDGREEEQRISEGETGSKPRERTRRTAEASTTNQLMSKMKRRFFSTTKKRDSSLHNKIVFHYNATSNNRINIPEC
ncbi:hypothetical protein OESDEN_05270 [Oesophagostomum dentatum]|uniref:Uncharacterized protein n=1 Tax=Oesophagostomum dentatum TaxID=61180 RepID=A0A0B1TFB3_OESDE|nr:hypothetical protein OESDEN_05270 [Oesophagostomum dentatum]